MVFIDFLYSIKYYINSKCMVFLGMLMHSHDYRSAEPLAGKSVVLLGAGLSGLDIAMELSNVDAQVCHSVKLFSYL